eukprot:499966-Rhodomonas_salina.1
MQTDTDAEADRQKGTNGVHQTFTACWRNEMSSEAHVQRDRNWQISDGEDFHRAFSGGASEGADQSENQVLISRLFSQCPADVKCLSFVAVQDIYDDAEVMGNDVLGVIDRVDSHAAKNSQLEEDYNAPYSVRYNEGMYTARPERTRSVWAACLCAPAGEANPNQDILDPNSCHCTHENAARRAFMRLAVHKALERVWLLASLAHNALLLADQHTASFIPPPWIAALFMAVYLTELFIKCTAFGMWGARYAYLNYDIFNRIDFLATCSAVCEFVASLWGATFTLRGFRLFRLLRPLLKVPVFADMGSLPRLPL